VCVLTGCDTRTLEQIGCTVDTDERNVTCSSGLTKVPCSVPIDTVTLFDAS
jgi:hypothetical protein